MLDQFVWLHALSQFNIVVHVTYFIRNYIPHEQNNTTVAATKSTYSNNSAVLCPNAVRTGISLIVHPVHANINTP